MRFPIVVQLLHSVQALPHSSDKLGPVSVTFQTNDAQALPHSSDKLGPVSVTFQTNDAQTGLASAKKNSWKNKLRSRSTSPKLRKTVSIPEVILQSTFSQTVTSLSKQKRVNAHGHNSATSYFDDETSGAFYC